MQDGRKAFWSTPYILWHFFPSLKQNFIAYSSFKVSDWIFEIYQLWQSGFSRVYFSCCYSCSFEPEIIRIGQSSHKMYSNHILNFQVSMTILNVCTKNVWKLIEGTTYFQKWLSRLGPQNTPTASLQRIILTPRVSAIWHQKIWWWGSCNARVSGNMESSLITIAPRFSLVRSGNTW